MPRYTINRPALWMCLLAAGSCLALPLMGCQSIEPAPQPTPQPRLEPRATAPAAPVDSGRAQFIQDMAATFAKTLGSRVNVDQKPYRLLVALREPDPQFADQTQAFTSALLSDSNFTDNFAMVILKRGQGVESLSGDVNNPSGPRSPDGQPINKQYPPNAIYLTQITYDEMDLASGPRFSMKWRVTHPNSGQIIMNKSLRQQLVQRGGEWVLVDR